MICQRCISKTPPRKLEQIKEEERANRYPKLIGSGNESGISTATTIVLDYQNYGGLDIVDGT